MGFLKTKAKMNIIIAAIAVMSYSILSGAFSQLPQFDILTKPIGPVSVLVIAAIISVVGIWMLMDGQLG